MFPAAPVQALDVVFNVDSGAAADLQQNLKQALGPLITALQGTSLHIGVVTSDLGSSGGRSVGTVGQGGCAGFGDGGLFKGSFALLSGSFLTSDPPNYDGAMQPVLGQMLSVGATGCGYEQPFATTRIALDVNAGFLRDDASLAIVILTDEDDCSLDPGLLEPSIKLGPLASFRCTTQGVVCDQPLDVIGPKTNCRPNKASTLVEDPQITRRALASIKPRSELLTVSAIVGNPTQFAVEGRVINGMDQLRLVPSCSWQSPTGANVADPPVRIASLVHAYQSRGALESACNPDLRPAVTRIATTIKRSLGIACVEVAADRICTARDVAGTVVKDLSPCPAVGDCFEIVADPVACSETRAHHRVSVDRKTTPEPGTRTELYCEE